MKKWFDQIKRREKLRRFVNRHGVRNTDDFSGNRRFKNYWKFCNYWPYRALIITSLTLAYVLVVVCTTAAVAMLFQGRFLESFYLLVAALFIYFLIKFLKWSDSL